MCYTVCAVGVGPVGGVLSICGTTKPPEAVVRKGAVGGKPRRTLVRWDQLVSVGRGDREVSEPDGEDRLTRRGQGVLALRGRIKRCLCGPTDTGGQQ